MHLSAIVASDLEAFALWVARVEPLLRGSLHGFATTVDTEAVVQETLLRTWQVAERCEPDGKPNGLLRMALRIARNLSIDEARRRRPDRVPAEELPADESVDPVADEPSRLGQWVRECLETLARRPAAAIRARLESGGELPDRELARRLDMKLNTFLQNVTRARRAMAECLRRKGVDLGAWTS